MNIKYGAGITLYNPSPDEISNALSYSDIFSIVYIFDNTEYNSHDKIRLFEQNKKIKYISKGKNLGLPEAFNQILEMCKMDNIDYLCTLDQDSHFTKDNYREIVNYIESHNMNNTAIVAPRPVDYVYENCLGEKTVENSKWAICSGSFLNLGLLSKNKISYDNYYFVDRFDVDLCKQIKNKGLSIIKLNYVQMLHACGDYKHNHNALRNYYLFRNRRYYNNKYYSKPIAIFLTLLQDIRQLIAISREDKKSRRAKLISYKLAKQSYKNGDYGKAKNEIINQLSK